MHRRTFLQLSATLMSTLLFRKGAEEDYSPAKAPARAMPLCLCTVAGLQYNEGRNFLPRLRPGQPLTLRREPENRHDPLAIAVFAASDRKLGYLPRRLNEIPAKLMDSGRSVVARVKEVNAEAPPWEAVEMEVGVAG